MVAEARFLFIVCQVGAESAVKSEMARQWPDFRLAFSRPGFITFKLPATMRLARDFKLDLVFARTYGFSLGKVSGNEARILASKTWDLVGALQPDHLHVWQRDPYVPGDNDFEPGPTLLAHEVGELIAQSRPSDTMLGKQLPLNQTASIGEQVLDCVLVEPNEWWIGFHEAASTPLTWPGGVPPIRQPKLFVSRAYYKITEALLWSGFPLKRGDQCVEIGSAPGGSSAALLERGYSVIGIDPAEMDPEVIANPNFVHVRKRASDMKRREFRTAKWLFADANISPQQTLSMVQDIVTHREVHVRGMLLTLKLSDWQVAESVPDFVAQVSSWGFEVVRCRQLAFNRQEVCLAALRSRAIGGVSRHS